MDSFIDALQFENLTSTFTVADIVLLLFFSFALTSIVAWVYRATHHGVSYSQSVAQTMVLLGMLVGMVMAIVGTNIASAFTLVGALSIVRFRNAVKETRDVGFIFFAMAVGMATGTQFYWLAVIATLVICLIIMMMDRFNWFALDIRSQIIKVQLDPQVDPDTALEPALVSHTDRSDLVSVESIRGGALTEVIYSVVLKKSASPTALVNDLRERSGGQKVTLLTGYDRSDL